MKFTHADIEVTYNEDHDRWEFELRGRSRTAVSPVKAKEYIDKEPAPKKATPFPKFAAFKKDYTDFIAVTVTSIADYTNSGMLNQVRIQGPGGREKIYVSRLAADTPENVTKIVQINEINAQIATQHEQIEMIMASLAPITIPEEFR